MTGRVWTTTHSATPGPSAQRISILRSLTADTDNPTSEVARLVKECHSLVGGSLTGYSRAGLDENDKVRVFPYGARSARQTRVFKKVVSPTFGVTLANIYPFVLTPKSSWELKLKEHNYTITRLWPYSTLCRYTNFVGAFVKHRRVMFSNYEDAGGEYHSTGDGSDTEPAVTAGDGDSSAGSVDSSTDDDNMFSQQ